MNLVITSNTVPAPACSPAGLFGGVRLTLTYDIPEQPLLYSGITSSVSGSVGKATINKVDLTKSGVEEVPINITATKTVTSPSIKYYNLACWNGAAASAGVASQVLLKSHSCLTESYTVSLAPVATPPWVVSYGGDVFAQTVSPQPSQAGTVTGGFTPYLLGAAPGYGYAFSDSQILLPERTYDFSTNKGGFAQNTSSDSFINKMTFTPPTHGDVKSATTLTFSSGSGVYTMPVSTFNTLVSGATNSFSVSGGGTAVLYLTGAGTDVLIKGTLTSSNGNLVIITGSPNSFSLPKAPRMSS